MHTAFCLAAVAACAVVMVLAAGCGDDGGPADSPSSVSPLAEGTPLGDGLDSPQIASCEDAVPAAATNIGERQTVQGIVAATRVIEEERGRTVLLELGAEGGEAPLAIAIPESALTSFREPPQDAYRGLEVCVRGVVMDYRGMPAIFVSSPVEIARP